MANTTLVAQMDERVKNGQIIEAVQQFFSDDAKTQDFDGTVTENKKQMLAKMEKFLGGIAAVNGITLHNSVANGTVSMSEFTFDFDMKDGNKVLWHEIIRRKWQGDKVIHEQYFKA